MYYLFKIVRTKYFIYVKTKDTKEPYIQNRNYFRFIHQACGYAFQLIYILGALPSQIINIYLMRGDLLKMVDGFFFTLTCISCTSKLGVFFMRRKEIESFFERLHDPIFSPRQSKHLEIMQNCMFIAKVTTLIFLIMPQVTSISWIIIPLIDSSQVN